MPSPAALAKYVMAIMVAPLNQEALNTPLYQGNRDTLDHYATRNFPLPYTSEITPLDYATRNFPLHYASENTPCIQGDTHMTASSGIYICRDGGFSGYCHYYSKPFEQCSQFTP